jgi:hypothetical protein
MCDKIKSDHRIAGSSDSAATDNTVKHSRRGIHHAKAEARTIHPSVPPTFPGRVAGGEPHRAPEKKHATKNGTGTRTVPQAATRAYPRRSRPSSPTNSNSTQVAGAPGPPSVTARASAGRSWGARPGARPRGGARRLGIPAASAWRGAARRGGTGGRAIGAGVDWADGTPCPRAQLD